jgi:hypothetical protein
VYPPRYSHIVSRIDKDIGYGAAQTTKRRITMLEKTGSLLMLAPGLFGFIVFALYMHYDIIGMTIHAITLIVYYVNLFIRMIM